jgi:hypothetical protein
LLLSAAARASEPTEPLKVTRLGDPESELQISAASDNIGVPAGDRDAFGYAVSAAVRAQQQSMEAICQSIPTAKSSIAARWAWEARCRYRRY